MMPIQDLVLAGLLWVGTDHKERIPARPLDVRPELRLQILRHHVRVQRMWKKIIQRDHVLTNPCILESSSLNLAHAVSPFRTKPGSTPTTRNSRFSCFFSSVATAGRCL